MWPTGYGFNRPYFLTHHALDSVQFVFSRTAMSTRKRDRSDMADLSCPFNKIVHLVHVHYMQSSMCRSFLYFLSIFQTARVTVPTQAMDAEHRQQPSKWHSSPLYHRDRFHSRLHLYVSSLQPSSSTRVGNKTLRVARFAAMLERRVRYHRASLITSSGLRSRVPIAAAVFFTRAATVVFPIHHASQDS